MSEYWLLKKDFTFWNCVDTIIYWTLWNYLTFFLSPLTLSCYRTRSSGTKSHRQYLSTWVKLNRYLLEAMSLLVPDNRTCFMSRPFLEGHKGLPDIRLRQSHRDNNRDIARTGQEPGLFQCISIYIEPSHWRAGTLRATCCIQNVTVTFASGQRTTLPPLTTCCFCSGLFNLSHVVYWLDRCWILTLNPIQP